MRTLSNSRSSSCSVVRSEQLPMMSEAFFHAARSFWTDKVGSHAVEAHSNQTAAGAEGPGWCLTSGILKPACASTQICS